MNHSTILAAGVILLIMLLAILAIDFIPVRSEQQATVGDYEAAIRRYRDAVRSYRNDCTAFEVMPLRVFEHHLMRMDLAHEDALDIQTGLHARGYEAAPLPSLHSLPLIKGNSIDNATY